MNYNWQQVINHAVKEKAHVAPFSLLKNSVSISGDWLDANAPDANHIKFYVDEARAAAAIQFSGDSTPATFAIRKRLGRPSSATRSIGSKTIARTLAALGYPKQHFTLQDVGDGVWLIVKPGAEEAGSGREPDVQFPK